ncbi:MAG: RecX family transcriptional regulator [Bacteroidales bacterium]|nr:RecX family transcriptional regulator [Bacteroidales bacterium]
MQKANIDKAMLDRMRQVCSKSEKCTRDIAEKLKKLDYEGDAESLIETLVVEGFINETRYAQSVVNDKLKFSRWGKAKIRYFLKGKGINSYAIDDALNTVSEPDYEMIIQKELEKKLRTLKETDKTRRKQKLLAFAMQRGYSPEIVYRILNDIG